MLLSIIVLTYNQKDLTLNLIKSLKSWFDRHNDSELIIIDNGSSDGTKEAVVSLPEIKNFNLKYIYNSINRGVAAGRNIGLRKASGKYIMILDNDTEVSEEAISSLIGYMDCHLNCGLCAPALYSKSGTLQNSAKPFPSIFQKISHLFNKKGELKSERIAMDSLHPYYVIGACQLFQKKLIEKIGYLDENIFYGPEDADWCERIRKYGLTIDYLQEIKIIHHWQRATNHSPFSKLSFAHFKGLLYFYFKHKKLF